MSTSESFRESPLSLLHYHRPLKNYQFSAQLSAQQYSHIMAMAGDVEALEELFDAIQSATADRVRVVLRDICIYQPTAFEAAYQKLLVDDGETFDVGDEEEDESAPEARASPKTPKRRVTKAAPNLQAGSKRRRYEICHQCDEEYDAVANARTSCVYHDGTLRRKALV
ncbi:uncharacterized protein N0V89_003619 [Didymosphaeria variabile]|uniref:Uncharacterized protein n=1 Tax=Didymosphaeria variabile TaxID=1932322 RepID=A0A9W9CBN9_9PLEO|nr:uncharacterized protein N0V89_003619 [Didymosphaeria variabile]KAJ4355599.1 hypothetical protein N0V89_003619 [Didymosphaeria variabile]